MLQVLRDLNLTSVKYYDELPRKEKNSLCSQNMVAKKNEKSKINTL